MNKPKKIGGQKGALARRQTRVGTWFGMLFISIFWNGIVSVFLWQLITGAIGGPMAIGLGIFLTPFVLVGLLLIGLFFHTTLALFNPTIDVTIDKTEIRLGDKITGKWRTKGNAARMSQLTITLEGTERATYRQGTSTSTDTSLFVQVQAASTKRPREMERGSFEVTVPIDAMHSFDAPNNKIIWSIVVKGEIPRWPDVDECFAVHVLPAPRSITSGDRNV